MTMSDHERVLQEFVLESLANDYESFVCVVEQVMKGEAEKELVVSRGEVARALEQTIREGYAQAYLLSAQAPYSLAVEFSSDRIDDLWFYVTPKGKQLVSQL